MPVSDRQAATMRALLEGHIDEHKRLLASLDRKADALGYSALVTAAFHNAIDLRFSRDSTLDEVTEFVAQVRSHSEELRDEVDPRTAERVIIAAVGGGDVSELSSAESNKFALILLAELVIDAHYDEAGMDEFVVKARALADKILAV
jgi:hypothetical protein